MQEDTKETWLGVAGLIVMAAMVVVIVALSGGTGGGTRATGTTMNPWLVGAVSAVAIFCAVAAVFCLARMIAILLIIINAIAAWWVVVSYIKPRTLGSTLVTALAAGLLVGIWCLPLLPYTGFLSRIVEKRYETKSARDGETLPPGEPHQDEDGGS